MEPNPTQNLINGGEKMEQIEKPAIRVQGGRIFTGKDHAEILITIHTEDMKMLNGREEGFVTNTGRFVSRREASSVAFKAGQIPEDSGPLSSQLLKYYSKKN